MKRAKVAQRFAAFVLCAAMVAGMLPATAFAETQDPPLQAVEGQQEAEDDSLPAQGSPAETGGEDSGGSQTAGDEGASVPGDVPDGDDHADGTDAGEKQDPEPEEGDDTGNPPQGTASETETPDNGEETGAVPYEAEPSETADVPTRLLGATADTFTHSLNSDADKNKGTSATLRIRNNNTYYAHIYEKFDLAQVVSSSGYLIKAVQHQMTLSDVITIDVSNVKQPAAAAVKIGYLPDNTWGETAITHNNFTKNQTSITNITSVTIPAGTAKNTTITADLTSILKTKVWPDSELSLDLFKDYSADEGENVFIYARENGSNGPALNIVYETAYTAEQTLLEGERGEAVTFTLPVHDTNNNSVTLESVHIPAGASFEPGTGAFSWTPSQAGKEAVVVLVKDSGGQDLGYYMVGLRQLTLEADGGSYISEADPGTAYHVQESMNAKDGAFVTFDLAEDVLSGEIVEAILELHTVDPAQTGEIALGVMERDTGVCNWDGTYQSLYAATSNSIATTSTENGVLSVNVTAAVQSERSNDGRITFKLQSLGGGDMEFVSDNASNRAAVPVLRVRTKMKVEDCGSVDAIMQDLEQIGLTGAGRITENLVLSTVGSHGTKFTWQSLDTDYLSDNGTITRPAYETMDVPVELLVTAENGNVKKTCRYVVTIAKEEAPSSAQASPALERVQIDAEVTALVDQYWKESTFTYVDYPVQKLDNVVSVSEKTGTAIQNAINEVSQAGGGVVQLEAGVYVVDQAIQMCSNVTLAGQGRTKSILMQAETWTNSANAMLISLNNTGDITQITDVVLKDLSLYGQKTSSVDVSGIFGNGNDAARHDRIMLQSISIKHFAGIGFEVKRANNIIMDRSTFMDNGASNSLYHNVYFLYNKNILQSNLDMSRPATGKSCKYTSTTNVIAQHIVMRDGKSNAVQADNTGADYILFHDYTIDNFEGYGLWFPCEDYMDKYTYKEDPIFAPQHVILNRVSVTNTKTGGIWRIVNDSYILNSYFNNRRDNLQLLKCDVTIQNTVFEGPDNGPTHYTSKDQLPDPIL